MKKTNVKLKNTIKIVAVMGISLLFMNLYSCQKSDSTDVTSQNEGAKKYDIQDFQMVDTAFVALDSTDTNRVFTVYDNCRNTVGTLTTSNKKLIFTSQTSSTVTISGTSSLALSKGVDYWFRPNGCSTGNYILKVKFSSGIQPLCNSFKLSTCTWSLLNSCGIVSTYTFVGTLPSPC